VARPATISSIRDRNPGVLDSSDLFFNFVGQRYLHFCYPPLPRGHEGVGEVVAGQSLQVRYTDFASRETSQEISRREKLQSILEAQGDPPPSFDTAAGRLEHEEESRVPTYENLNLEQCTCHQDTDFGLATHAMVRELVQLQFVDDKGLLLRDDLWLPGGFGLRRIYEVSTNDPRRLSLHIQEGLVPTAQLISIFSMKETTTGRTAPSGGLVPPDTPAGGRRGRPRRGEEGRESSPPLGREPRDDGSRRMRREGTPRGRTPGRGRRSTPFGVVRRPVDMCDMSTLVDF